MSAADGFHLSETVSFTVRDDVGAGAPRWMEPAHLPLLRKALIVLAGETIRFPLVRIGPDHVLHSVVGPGLPEISRDGLTAEFVLCGADGWREELVAQTITNRSGHWREVTIDLGAFRGMELALEIRCGPGPENDPCADWLAVYELEVGRRDLVPYLRAQSFRAWRTANEVAHFASVYRHELYAGENAGVTLVAAKNSGRDGDRIPAVRDAYTYSWMHLQEHTGRPVPDFGARLRRLGQGRELRVLSLCSGAARVEAGLARHAEQPMRITLIDLNGELLQQARLRFPAWCRVETVVQDVNDLRPDGSTYDVILCVSGMHHIVALERVSASIGEMLAPGGEYWSIGEQIGRNGSRLWPEAYEEADAFFRRLPEKYRFNRVTGRLDAELPNLDCSVGSFEGIRSEEIEAVYDRFFSPVEVHRQNCFLWRLVDLCYIDNYDLDDPEDRRRVEAAVAAELDHWRRGGRPTELNGAYMRR